MTPTDEQKRAWRMSNTVRQFAMLTEVEFYMLQLADAFRDALAEVRRLEFEREHQSGRRDDVVWCYTCDWIDPRHEWTADDWKRQAEKELSE